MNNHTKRYRITQYRPEDVMDDDERDAEEALMEGEEEDDDD